MIRYLRAAVLVVLCLCPEAASAQYRLQPPDDTTRLHQTSVVVEPRFYETGWFLALSALVAIGVGAGVFAMRVRRLKRNEQRLTRLVQERTAELSETNAQLEVANEALELLATADALTGLANRRRFDHFMQVEWHRADRTRQPLALLMIDVDHFKAYNDTYGHHGGDAVLRKVASVLRLAATRLSDLAARHGGEEFAVVLVETSPEGALAVAEFVRRSVEELKIPHSASPFGVLTVSLGVATRTDGRFPQMADLVVACDKALYESKARGRNRVSAAAPE